MDPVRPVIVCAGCIYRCNGVSELAADRNPLSCLRNDQSLDQFTERTDRKSFCLASTVLDSSLDRISDVPGVCRRGYSETKNTKYTAYMCGHSSGWRVCRKNMAASPWSGADYTGTWLDRESIQLFYRSERYMR